MKYLYGANVHGIQKFIFDTKKLKEIIGASEIIEQVCTQKFAEAIGKGNIPLKGDDNSLLNAAGHIRYIFDDEDLCRKVVRTFPKNMSVFAPGLRIIQAVVKVRNEVTEKDLHEIEKRLRTLKTAPSNIQGLSLMITERSRRTGKGAVSVIRDKEEQAFTDQSQHQKIKISSKNSKLLEKFTPENIDSERFPDEFEKMTTHRQKNWLAVVHADGNNLGRIIQRMAGMQGYPVALKEFSGILEASTVKAAREALQHVFKNRETGIIPARPVILGGDDLTIVIGGEFAVLFTKLFLSGFEKYTREYLNKFADKHQLDFLSEGLTACAGIAFIKSKYPFHYGAELANSLCEYSKNDSKNLNPERAPSCLTFHKVQSGFVESYTDIIGKELTTAGNISMNYGPYYIHQQQGKPDVDSLLQQVALLKEKDAPASGLRKWLTELHRNPDGANQVMNRITALNEEYVPKLGLSNAIKNNKTHIYNLLSLASLS